MKYLLALVLVLCLVGVVQAVEPKAGVLYELADNSPLEIVGASVVSDVGGIKNLDIDTFIGNDIGQVENNDNVTALTGISYNYNVNDKLALGVGVAIGTKRFENLKDTGESKYGAYMVASYKF